MRKSFFTFLLIVLVLGFSTAALADLSDFLVRVDAQARVDLGRFNVNLSAQFGVPLPKVDLVVRSVARPADAFMVFQLGVMTGRPPELVLSAYEKHRGKGWGVIAKELGIKPGSPEFHALKRGDFELTGDSAGKSRGKEKGKGRKH